MRLILVRAREAMKNYGVTKYRIVFKGYSAKTLKPALAFLEDFPFECIRLAKIPDKYFSFNKKTSILSQINRQIC